MKRLHGAGDSRTRVRLFPSGIQNQIGYALYIAQMGGLSARAKPLRGLGTGVLEIAAGDEHGTFRAVYSVMIGDAIYVIHAFQKKSRAALQLRNLRST